MDHELDSKDEYRQKELREPLSITLIPSSNAVNALPQIHISSNKTEPLYSSVRLAVQHAQ
jgi:hypothetical protein